MKTAQLGIELGTRHLRICTRDKEEFLKIKNMIAFDEDAKLKAFGNEAFAMYEKQPYSIHVVKPMEHGVISDYTNMRYLLGTVLDHYFKRIRKSRSYDRCSSGYYRMLGKEHLKILHENQLQG